jgi:mannose-1-phosphate guanylyltransferase
VIGHDHDRFARAQLIGLSHHVLREPASRDTGTAIFVALAMLHKWSPDAVVTITPTDHYVSPAARYVAALGRAQHLAASCRDRIVVLAANPREVDPDLGYIVPGGPQGIARPVAEFVETPSPERAQELSEAGALWNTMTCCATVSALWRLGCATVPQLMEVIDRLDPFIDTEHEDAALGEIYRAAPAISFSRDVLERAPERLLVIALDDIEWSDLGTPDRVEGARARRSERIAS